MAIAWDTLEYRLTDYFEKGKDDKTRTYEKTAIDIEDMYIDTIRNQAQDQFGNFVLSLNKFGIAATLRQGFKSSMDLAIPSVPDIKTPKPPEVPTEDLPTVPGIPAKPNISLPSAFGLPNVPTEELPVVPGMPGSPGIPNLQNLINTFGLSIPIDTVNLQNLPNASAVTELFPSSNLPAVPSFEIPQVPGMPEIPSIGALFDLPKMPAFEINLGALVPKVLNTLGLSGLLLAWSGVQLAMIVPPPGSVKVINNVVVNPGSFPTMNLGAAGSELAKELVQGFKQHARTVTGMTTSLVYSGTTLVPVQFPWTGLN